MEIDGTEEVQVVGYNEVVGYQKMKIDKYSAILGNTVGFHDMGGLTEHRPIASLPFGGKYRLIDFPLSNLANAGIRSIFGIFKTITSVLSSTIFVQVVSGACLLSSVTTILVFTILQLRVQLLMKNTIVKF